MLVDLLCQSFEFLEKERHCSREITRVDNFRLDLSYQLNNIRIILTTDRDNYFILRVVIGKEGSDFCISDTSYNFLNTTGTKPISIFGFTQNISKNDFLESRKELFKKSGGVFYSKKALISIIELYRQLIMDCFDRIMDFARN